MRSRYSAFVEGDAAHLLATWHPDTRPPSLELDAGTRWLGLDVLAVVDGGLLAATGEVEFRASYRHDGARGAQHERSRFTRVEGRWYYLDGVALP
jgi:SEC-C motif-containing protein